MDTQFSITEGEKQTSEEELLGALLDANEALFGALRMYDDVVRLAEEQAAVEISRRDVKMDRRVSVFSYFCLHQSFCLSNHYSVFCSVSP